MSKYPIFLELTGRRVVVIGAGSVAARKAESLLAVGARLVVVAEDIDEVLVDLCKSTTAELIRSKYSREYLINATLVIAATNDHQLNKQIYEDCQELEILCNIVDQPEICDFFVPAVVRRGDLQIAIGTEGQCPAYSGHIKKKLEQIFTDKHGQFLAELESLRKHIIESITDPIRRKAILGQLADDRSFEYFTQNGPAAWRKWAEKAVKE
jgi:precorrin-2 dehydrogenase/sirohydrochlorin ferrochelatase